MFRGRRLRNLLFPFPIQSNRSGVSMLIHNICIGHEVIDTITQCFYGIDCQIIINSDFLGRFVCEWYWNREITLYFKEHWVFICDWISCELKVVEWSIREIVVLNLHSFRKLLICNITKDLSREIQNSII